MIDVDDEKANCNEYTAAEWFVALDAEGAANADFADNPDSAHPSEQVESWLAESSEHEDAARALRRSRARREGVESGYGLALGV